MYLLFLLGFLQLSVFFDAISFVTFECYGIAMTLALEQYPQYIFDLIVLSPQSPVHL